jgi:aromatic-L-amino-acid decarboxylase
VEAEPGWEVVAPYPFSVVCFRCEGSDVENARILERVNATGEIFISHTELDGRYVLRLAVGNMQTTEADVARAWELLRETAG